MPLVFSYGSLQQESVQLATYGRLLHGDHDELAGFELEQVPIEDAELAAELGRSHHANAVPSSKPDARVAGMVFEFTAAELATTDRYELRDSYRRIAVTLTSEKCAWVYVFDHAAQPE